MEMECLSCRSRFKLGIRVITETGLLIKCPECNYIHMVYPPDYDEQPIVEDTNIDQSILYELFVIEKSFPAPEACLDEIILENDDYEVPDLNPIEDFDEEQGHFYTKNNQSTDLPDLSEYERMIDCDDADPRGLSANRASIGQLSGAIRDFPNQ
jgi:hypothetical protein